MSGRWAGDGIFGRATFDILKMTGRFQYEWTHEIEPTHSDLGPRLNATFRSVEKHHYKCPSYKK